MQIIDPQKFSKIIVTLILVAFGGAFFFGVGFGVAPTAAAPTELFFSEYLEGASNNKALEIYNGTGTTIDLAANDYDVQFFFNGDSAAGVTIALTGTIETEDVYILAHSSADPAILAEADQTSGAPFFNGDDAITLRKDSNIIDVIGQFELDPGDEWGADETSTKDNSLRRKSSIETGDPVGDDPFDPATEWDGFPKDEFSGLGWHSIESLPTATPTADTAPFVASNSPFKDESDVTVDTTVEIEFSEAVDLGTDWFRIDCTTSGTRQVEDTEVTGGPTYWTITPKTNFANGEDCTVTIDKDQVTDQDGTPDPMAADNTFSFTTISLPSGWIINEIHADPDGDQGDANGDGEVDTGQDEFVEIVNSTGEAVDISGWTLADEVGIRYTFPDATIVRDQCAIVVFGGGSPAGTFGQVIVQTASSGTLGLNNGGDTISLNNKESEMQISYPYGSEGGDNQSLTRTPDITGADPLVRHSTATGAGGTLFSPGTKVDGSIFSGCSLPYVTSTTPVSDAQQVTISTTIEIKFSEVVAVNADTFALECPAGTPVTIEVAPPPPGNADTYTLTPTSDLPNDMICTFTVNRDGIVDQDDAPDYMAEDYVFSFQTAASPPTAAPLLISEFLYDGATPSTEGDEFVEICNLSDEQVSLNEHKIGDEETEGGGESMYRLPDQQLAGGGCLVIVKDAVQFKARFPGVTNFVEVGGLDKYTKWGSGSWSLSNTGDELVLLGPNDEILDSVAYRNGDYAALGLEADASAPEPHSLQRVWPTDTDSMPHDFVSTEPTPGALTKPPPPPDVPPAPAQLPGGMQAYWGDLHSHTTYSDGAGPPHYALAVARQAGLHFYGITDHGWWMTLDEWTRTLSQTTAATVPGQFVALRGLEYSHSTTGHINVFNSDTLLSRINPMFDELSEFYSWLAANPAAIAQFNHPDPSYGGTFDDFAYHPAAAQMIFMQEIGNNAQEYTTYEPSFVQGNMAGWRVAPTNNGDTHTANWGKASAARTGLIAPALTEADLLEAMRARRVFATEDSNLALALRLDGAWMGTVLPGPGDMSLTVDFVDPDSEPLTLFVYDSNLLLAEVPLSGSTGQWSTTVKTLPGHFYWARAVQADGDTAYSAPVWIEGDAPADTIYVNEILPAPLEWDWDGNGTADHQDEWLELYNPLSRPVGLGGWRLRDASGITYDIPLGISIPAGGLVTFYQSQTNFSLNNGGDTITLIHPDGTTIDTFSYPHSPGYDESWCRLPSGGPTWSDACGPSPGTANWKQEPAGPLTLNIYEAKRVTPGAWVRVKGRVTAPPGVLGARNMYVQDETAGILVYLPKDHRHQFNLGDKVEVEGNLRSFHEEAEIAVRKRSDVKFLHADTPPPPLPIATTSLLEPYEGRLALLQGQAVQFRGRTRLWVDDGTGWAQVYIRRSTGIKKPFIEIGTPITVVGVVSQYSDKDNPSRHDYRLMLRYPSDLILSEPPPAPPDWPILLPDTGQR